MYTLRLIVLLLIAMASFGPRCAMAQAPAQAAHHQSQPHHPAPHHDMAACEGVCIGCAVASQPSATGIMVEVIERADPAIRLAALTLPHITSLDLPPPRIA